MRLWKVPFELDAEEELQAYVEVATPYAAVLELEEQIPLDGANPCVQVHQKSVAGLGANTLAYVRTETSDCWRFFEDARKRNTNIALSGPPGTGKSTTAWAWARWRALHNQVVLWYHVDKNGTAKLILADNQIRRYKSQQLEVDPNVEIVVVDGVTQESWTSLVHACTSWRASSRGMFILVSSEASEVALEQMQNWQIASYSMPSWTLEDYLQACKDEMFSANVQVALLNCPNPNRAKTFSVEAATKKAKYEERTSIESLINKKFYYAGGSARWMFQFSYLEWQPDVNTQLTKVENYATFSLSGNKYARLRGLKMVAGVPVYYFISEYVGVQLAQLAAKWGSQHQFIADVDDVANRLDNLSRVDF